MMLGRYLARGLAGERDPSERGSGWSAPLRKASRRRAPIWPACRRLRQEKPDSSVGR